MLRSRRGVTRILLRTVPTAHSSKSDGRMAFSLRDDSADGAAPLTPRWG
eukprot:CAMPEP_0113996348 /NCGR_PEP_ID=MMETSP0328-20130328/11704_1 /TAXON_ID=39455 /ORGANISM="Alexandrium minutum" /LENGTH=48 /assembly_acc=CAM_ASM_000350